VVPDFLALAFGGTVKGRVTMRFDGLKFRADTHVQDVQLAGVLPAIEHTGFPVDELHWDTLVSADTTETWSGPFQHLRLAGRWNGCRRTPSLWDTSLWMATGIFVIAMTADPDR